MRGIKYILSCAIGAMAICGSANAADYAAGPTPFDWSGLYFGVHAGYGWPSFQGIFDNSELPDFPEDATYASDIVADGFLGGVQAGFNVQHGSLVFGGEADVSLTGFSGTAGDSDANDTIDASVDTLSSLRARLGFANGPILAFLTGGIAYASGDFTISDNIGEFDENSGSGKIGAFGGVVGGGIEVAASRHVSMRVEGLYYFFDERIDTSDFTDDSDEGDYFGIDNTFVVRAALNFRL